MRSSAAQLTSGTQCGSILIGSSNLETEMDEHLGCDKYRKI